MADNSHTSKKVFKNTNDEIKNTSDDEFLRKMKIKLKGFKFPSDFDTWTVQEQNDWVYQDMTELCQNVPESLKNLIPAYFRSVDFDRSQEKLPEWLDIDKYRRGQKFVRDNYFSVVYCILFGAIYGFTFDDALKPIIIAGQSSTPYLAFKRYLDTIKRMMSWHKEEPWVKGSKAYTDMQFTRTKHLGINRKISRLSNEQIVTASKIVDPLYLNHEIFLKDISVASQVVKLEQCPYKAFKELSIKIKTVNNAEISIGQGCFIMLSIIHPRNIGIHNVTDEDLEAFCHMWRCYGYFLGVEDEYNFFRGSLEEIKQRLWDLNRYWIQTNFMDIMPEWMHVTTCLAESINYYPFIYMSSKLLTILFTEALNIEVPNLYASLDYGNWIAYNLYRFLLRHALKCSIVRKAVNRFTQKILKMASNFGPETIVKLQEKSRQYLLDHSKNDIHTYFVLIVFLFLINFNLDITT